MFCVLSITCVAVLIVICWELYTVHAKKKKVWSSEKSPFETHGFQRPTNTETKPLPLTNGGAEGTPVTERTCLGFRKPLAVSYEMKAEGLDGSETSV